MVYFSSYSKIDEWTFHANVGWLINKIMYLCTSVYINLYTYMYRILLYIILIVYYNDYYIFYGTTILIRAVMYNMIYFVYGRGFQSC